jgi:hypothetical protein
MRAVDQNLDRIARARRRVSRRPAAGGRGQRAVASDAPQASLMMGADQPAELVPEPTLGQKQRLTRRRSQPIDAGPSRPVA